MERRTKIDQLKAMAEKIETVFARKNGNKFDYIAIIDGNEIQLRSKSARLYENAFVHPFGCNCGPGAGISGHVTYGKKTRFNTIKTFKIKLTA